MNAYDESYLEDAIDCLGEAFDYACNACSIDPDLFLSMFISSGYAKRFEAGEPRVIAGMSGTELAVEVLADVLNYPDLPPAQLDYSFSREYWCGWILAYTQWRTGRSFKNIRRHMPMAEVARLYNPLHEAEEEKFVEVFEDRVRSSNQHTNLQELRKLTGLTQKELSERSGVNLRSLQQYEIRAKDINKASATTLLALSRALGCHMEDLLEHEPVVSD